MDQQRLDAKKKYKELSFGKKLEHIWFYYKWRIICPLLALVLVGYSAYDYLSRPKYDFEGTFYSKEYISDEQLVAMEEYLSQFVEDRNGDGVKNIKIISASVAMLDNETEGEMTIYQKFSTEMVAGAYPFVIVDSEFYNAISQDVYSLAIEQPKELTAIPEFCSAVQLPDSEKVYWVTRAVYEDEKDDPDALLLHEETVKTEENIFGPR